MEEALRPRVHRRRQALQRPRELVSVTHERAPAFRLSRSERAGAAALRQLRACASTGRRTRLSLRRGSDFKVTGVECERAAPYLRAIAASFGLAAPYHLHLDEVIPPHAGLGSGTQLALAIGSAVATLEGLPLDLHEIAARLDRGKRSGIGIGTFEQGGAVLDGGPGTRRIAAGASAASPSRAHWRVLLIFDPAETGVHGASETAAFATLPDFPESETDDLTRRILLRRAAGACRRGLQDVLRCRSAICRRAMGAYFAPMQGGPYVSAGVAAVLKRPARLTASPGSAKAHGGRPALPSPPSEAEGQGAAQRLRACACRRRQASVSSWRKAATSPPSSRRASGGFLSFTLIETLFRHAPCGKACQPKMTET